MDTIFTAIADPTRRWVLERLRHSGALSVNELSEPLQMSRQAVTKHLDILCHAGLVVAEKHGRERRHRLQAEPLKVVDDWLKPYAAAWDDALERLRQHLGETNES